MHKLMSALSQKRTRQLHTMSAFREKELDLGQLECLSRQINPLISFPVSAHAQGAGVLAYCKEDAARLCKGVAPGGGKLIGSLKQHENEVSVGCAKELNAVKTKMGK